MKKMTFSSLFLLFFVFAICQDNSKRDPLSKGVHFASINGNTLHYIVRGEGPICLMPSPGWGPSIGGYSETMKPLEKHFTIVYYDTRLTGKSTGPDSTSQYKSTYYVQDMEALRQYLGQNEVWLAGHSGGGFQVLSYGIQYPEKVKGILSISALAASDSLRGAELQKRIQLRAKEPWFEKAIKGWQQINSLDADWNILMPDILPLFLADGSKVPLFETYMNNTIFTKELWKHYVVGGFMTEILLSDLKKITAPVLVITGDDDFICDHISQANRINAHLQNSTLLIIENSGHFPWIEQKTVFFEGIDSWLSRFE